MAFNLQAIVNSVTYELNDGSPFRLEGMTGGGVAAARRLSERGPLQHGDTDLGVRLQPRTVTLSLNLVAASASALDTARDTLNTIFKPVGETAVNYPVQLRVTRDDGGVRQLDCYTTGPADIPLVPANRPGNLHRAVVQLRAADPLWYDPTLQSAIITGETLIAWYLAGGAIGSANVLGTASTPGTAEAWSWSGTVAAGSPWTIALRTSIPEYVANPMFAFSAGTVETGGQGPYMNVAGETGTVEQIRMSDGQYYGQTLINSGAEEYNCFIITDDEAFYWTSFYVDNVRFSRVHDGDGVGQMLRGSLSKWRGPAQGPPYNTASNVWPNEISYAAIYDIALSAAQRSALNARMEFGTAAVQTYDSIVYSGNWAEYPIITIDGPISDPVVINTTTGAKLDFSGHTIGSGLFYAIDTRYGYKTAVDASGTNIISYLSDDSDLGLFSIVPSPYAAGGTNIFYLSGTAVGSAAAVNVSYYNRYTSF